MTIKIRPFCIWWFISNTDYKFHAPKFHATMLDISDIYVVRNQTDHQYVLYNFKYTVIFSWPLNNVGDWFQDLPRYQNLRMLKSHSLPSVSMVLLPQIQSTAYCVVLEYFIEKNLHMSGSAQFKPVLFRGQL